MINLPYFSCSEVFDLLKSLGFSEKDVYITTLDGPEVHYMPEIRHNKKFRNFQIMLNIDWISKVPVVTRFCINFVNQYDVQLLRMTFTTEPDTGNTITKVKDELLSFIVLCRRVYLNE